MIRNFDSRTPVYLIIKYLEMFGCRVPKHPLSKVTSTTLQVSCEVSMRHSSTSYFCRLDVVALCLFFVIHLIGVASADNSIINPERYELCKTDAEIAKLQQTYGLIAVTSIPTNAAMHPGWPETLISIVFAIYACVLAMAQSGESDPSSIYAAILWPGLVDIAWTISFALMQHDKATGGWISVEDGTTTTILGVWAMAAGNAPLSVILNLFGIFQGGGSMAVVIQRWKREIGSIAYLIIDSNGCTPYDGFEYLQQGARARDFRIIQTTEYFYCGFVITIVWIFIGIQEGVGSHKRLKGIAAAGMMFIYIPALVYEAIIATKGRPVVISGNCMLMELDPKWGFFDTEIKIWWKILMGFTGL